MKQNSSETVFAEFLAELQATAERQEKDKVEQLRRLLAAAKVESFPAVSAMGRYSDDRQ